MKNTVKNMLIASITCVVVSLSMMTSAVAEDNFKEGTTIYGGSVQNNDPSLPNFVPSLGDNNYELVPTRRDIIMPLSASGSQPIGGFTVKDIRIPSMMLDHVINGSGLTINSEVAEAEGLNLCNYRIDFQNRYGNTIYRTDVGNTYWGCKLLTTGPIYSRFKSVNRGVQCARVFVNGQYAGEQCHNIY